MIELRRGEERAGEALNLSSSHRTGLARKHPSCQRADECNEVRKPTSASGRLDFHLNRRQDCGPASLLLEMALASSPPE